MKQYSSLASAKKRGRDLSIVKRGKKLFVIVKINGKKRFKARQGGC
ncbi:MAG: 50S ribosomal protein L36 [Anaplasmataceae bacterium]|nr:50S ribosomal protein L36 [Anaplasmataceae bacterium]